jgi:hypothetical protein
MYIAAQLAQKVAEFARGLAAGYSVAVGGSVEESAKSQAPIEAVLMLFIMTTTFGFRFSVHTGQCFWNSIRFDKVDR